MKNLFYFLLIAFFLPNFGCVKKGRIIISDEKEFNGKVKTVREKTYEALLKDDKIVRGKPIGSFYDNFFSEYDTAGNKIKHNLYNANDSLSYRYEFIYNNRNQLVEKNVYDSKGTLSYKYLYRYNIYGNEIEQDILYPSGLLISKYKIKYKKNKESERIYFNATGAITNIYTYEYDEAGNLIASSVYDGESKLVSRYGYAYDANKNRIEECMYYGNGSLAHRYTYRYDNNGRLKEENQYGEDEQLVNRTTYSYNNDGSIKEVAHYKADNSLASIYIYKYDANGRLLEKQKIGENLNYKASFIYIDQDIHNNWVKRIEFLDNNPVCITVREIVYYN